MAEEFEDLNLPANSPVVEDRIKADVAQEATDSNPYLVNSWLVAFIVGFGRRIFDSYSDLKRALRFAFPDLTFGDGILRWAGIYGKEQAPATQSNGSAIATGVATTIIPSGTTLVANVIDADGNSATVTYGSTAAATITDQIINIASINRSGSTATVVTVSDHNLANNVPVTIVGAGEAEYNLTDTLINVTDTDSFTYQVVGTPATPASGVITAAFTSASAPVTSVDFGGDTNLDANAPLSLQAPIAGVDTELLTGAGAIGGGTDQETLESLQQRYLERIRNPVAHYNAADIADTARGVPGVTRVFVQEANTVVGNVAVSTITRVGNVATVTTTGNHGYDDGATTDISGAIEAEYNVTNARVIVESSTVFQYNVFGSPSTPATGTILSAAKVALGQSITYFMRDNDSNPIPSASEVQDVKDAIDAIRPANTSTQDNIVKAPIAVVVPFTFTALTPDTATMRGAIGDNLEQFYEEQTEVGVNIDEDAYRAAIINTIDPDTGQKLQTFELATPTGDVGVGAGGIGVLGVLSFS